MHSFSRLGAASLVAFGVFTSSYANATPPLTADYQFQNSLNSSIGDAPALTNRTSPGQTCPSYCNTFGTDTVNGVSTTLLQFPQNNGVSLNPTTSVLSNNGVYTIAMLFKLDDVTGYRRLIDYKNGTQDYGLYVYDGQLTLYAYGNYGGTVPAGDYTLVVVTRNASGIFTAYVNCTQVFSVDDSVNGYALIDSSNTLHFFQDNSSGAVSRIRIYDGAMTPAEVAGLGGECNLEPWSIVAPYPLTSESVSVSSDGAFAYAVGGFDSNVGTPTNAFNRYDPVANMWTPFPNIPTALYDAPSVYDPNTNSLYVFGGIDISFNVVNTTQIYHFGTNTWTTGTPMPAARYFAGAAYYGGNGKIYVIGGFNSSYTETNTTWEYDPVANTWDTTRANIPVSMAGSGYDIVGQDIYLAGTWNGGTGSTLHYRYDILADSWTQMANVPVPIYRPASGTIGTNIYLLGGGNPNLPTPGPQVALRPSTRAPEASYSSTYIYDTTTDTWSTGPSTNVVHGFTGGTAIGRRLLVVTGFDGVSGDTNTVEQTECSPPFSCGPNVRVGVTVSSSRVEEGQSTTFLIFAKPDRPCQPITVHYTLSGTAKPGIDYTLSGKPGQVTIPAGQALVTVTLHALEDNKTEKTEKANLTLQTGMGYKLTKPYRASVSIIDD
jgi:N-acetylneuraminic acid mutarotase